MSEHFTSHTSTQFFLINMLALCTSGYVFEILGSTSSSTSMWFLLINGSVPSTRGSKHRSTIRPTNTEVYTSIFFAAKVCSASTNETSSYQRVPLLPTTCWYLTYVAISRKKPSNSNVKSSGHGKPNHIGDICRDPPPSPFANFDLTMCIEWLASLTRGIHDDG